MAIDKLKNIVHNSVSESISDRIVLYKEIVQEIFRDEMFQISEIDRLNKEEEIDSVLIFLKQTISDNDKNLYIPFLNATVEKLKVDEEYNGFIQTVKKAREELKISLKGLENLENLRLLKNELAELHALANIANKDAIEELRKEIESNKQIISDRANEISSLEGELKKSRAALEKILKKDNDIQLFKNKTEHELLQYIASAELFLNDLSENFQYQNQQMLQKYRLTLATANQFIREVERLGVALGEIILKNTDYEEIYKNHILANNKVFGNLNYSNVISDYIKTKNITGAILEKQVKEHTDNIDENLQKFDEILKAIVETREKLKPI